MRHRPDRQRHHAGEQHQPDAGAPHHEAHAARRSGAVTRANKRLNAGKSRPGCLCSRLSRSTHRLGVSVSATMPEITTAIEIVTANWRYSSPVRPPRNAIGTNTAHSVSTIAITGPDTSRIALIAASRAAIFSSCMMRSTFSSTTIASSTTMPIASTMPNSVSVLIE